jgi:flagellar protein FliL
MFQNKMLQWLIMILIAITLIVLAGFVLWDYMDRKAMPADPNQQAIQSVENVKAQKRSAEAVKNSTVEIQDIMTNLSTKDIVKLSLAFEMDGEKSKKEFELLDFKVKAVIYQTLADTTPDQIRGSKGQDQLSATLINKINPLLTQGKVKQIYITYFVMG